MGLYDQAKFIANTYNVYVECDRLVLFSMSFLPSKENREKADRFLSNRPDYRGQAETSCGKELIRLGLEKAEQELSAEQIREIWDIVSQRLVAAASGNVTAFADGVDFRSTFVRIELPGLLQNKEAKTINHQDKFLFASTFGL